MLNGDILTDLDLTALLAHHRRRRATATITLSGVEDARPYGLVTIDQDHCAGFQRLSGEAAPQQGIRGAGLDHPFVNGAVVLLYIHVDPGVRIDPFHLGDGATQFHRLLRIEFGGECVMCEC